MKTKVTATATIHTGILQGVDAIAAEVTVTFDGRLPQTHIVDMAATSVKETAERVRSAIEESGIEMPKVRRNVDFGGAYVKGGGYDLPIAVAMLVAAGVVPETDAVFIGELSLGGDVLQVHGTIALGEMAARAGRTLFVPFGCAPKAALTGATVIGVRSLRELVAHLTCEVVLPPHRPSSPARSTLSLDMCDVVGNIKAKLALEVAAAGGHHVLLFGEWASDKLSLARCLPGIMPEMRSEERLQVAKHFDAAGLGAYPGHWLGRPFRAPHHGTSLSGLLGGGRPGELCLAHHGVILFSEAHEISRQTLANVCNTAVAGVTARHVAGGYTSMPCCFTAVMTTVPDERALGKVGEFGLCDIRAEVETVSRCRLDNRAPEDMGDSTLTIQWRVTLAQKRQQERQGGLNGQRADWTAVERVARTIADLEGYIDVEQRHLTEAATMTA